ncbi:hypothetical protein Tco_0881083 [Tanacetum coccineum]
MGTLLGMLKGIILLVVEGGGVGGVVSSTTMVADCRFLVVFKVRLGGGRVGDGGQSKGIQQPYEGLVVMTKFDVRLVPLHLVFDGERTSVVDGKEQYMIELRANATKAKNDIPIEAVAICVKSSFPQFETQSSTLVAAEDDADINR